MAFSTHYTLLSTPSPLTSNLSPITYPLIPRHLLCLPNWQDSRLFSAVPIGFHALRGPQKRSRRFGVHFAVPSAGISPPLHFTPYTLHRSYATHLHTRQRRTTCVSRTPPRAATQLRLAATPYPLHPKITIF